MKEQTATIDAPNGADHPPVLYLDPKLIRRSPFNRTVTLDPELALSVQTHGIIEPLIARKVQPIGGLGLELIAGERRLLAAKSAGLKEVPVIVRENCTDQDVLELQTIENDQREDLSPIDRAKNYGRLLAQYEKSGLKRTEALEKLCERIGRKKSSVYEILKLLDAAPQVQQATEKKDLPASHAALIASLPPDRQTVVLKDVLEVDEWEEPERTESGNTVMAFRDLKVRIDHEKRLVEKRRAWDLAVTEAKAKGRKVLNDRETRDALNKGCVDASRRNYDFPEPNTYKALMGKHAPAPILGRDERFEVVELYSPETVEAAIKANGRRRSHPGLNRSAQSRGVAEAKRMKEKAAKTRQETAERRAVVDAVVGAAGGRMNWTAAKSLEFLRFVVRAMKQRVLHDTHKEMFSRRKLDPKAWKKGYTAPSARWLDHQIKEVKTAEQARALIVDMAVSMDLTMWAGEFNSKEPKMLNVACDVFGVNAAKAKKAIPAAPKPGPHGGKVPVIKASGKKQILSAAGRKRLGELMKARWAARRKGGRK